MPRPPATHSLSGRPPPSPPAEPEASSGVNYCLRAPCPLTYVACTPLMPKHMVLPGEGAIPGTQVCLSSPTALLYQGSSYVVGPCDPEVSPPFSLQLLEPISTPRRGPHLQDGWQLPYWRRSVRRESKHWCQLLGCFSAPRGGVAVRTPRTSPTSCILYMRAYPGIAGGAP